MSFTYYTATLLKRRMLKTKPSSRQSDFIFLKGLKEQTWQSRMVNKKTLRGRVLLVDKNIQCRQHQAHALSVQAVGKPFTHQELMLKTPNIENSKTKYEHAEEEKLKPTRNTNKR